jgi:hypothetical protein
MSAKTRGRSAGATERKRGRLAYGLQCDRHSTRVDFSPTSLETRAQREKSPARRSSPSALLSPKINISNSSTDSSPHHLSSRAITRALRRHHHPPPCRHSAGLFLLLTSLLHHRVSINSTYHVRLFARFKNNLHEPAHLRYAFAHYPWSTANVNEQRQHPRNTAHRQHSKCRGETAA